MEMRTLRTGARFAGQASVLLTVFLAAPVFAAPDVPEYDGQKYNFSIVNVPDFDQKRAFSRDGTVHDRNQPEAEMKIPSLIPSLNRRRK